MFYSNEVSVDNLNTVPEIMAELVAQNIDRAFQVTEIMATDRQDLPSEKELTPFKETFTITVRGIEVQVISSLRYQRYTNGSVQLQQEVQVPMLNMVIQRKNAKKNLDGIRLYYADFKDNIEYKAIQSNHKARVLEAKREIIANLVLDTRKADVIDLVKAAEYRLHIQYDNTPEEDRLQFLVDNEFTGLDNLGFHSSRPDGYGHTCGTSTDIDFHSKNISLQSWSSDD